MEDYNKIWREVYGDLQEYGPVHRHMRRLFLKLISSLRYDTAVDVGCGNGNNLLILSHNRTLKRLVGTDISEEAIRSAANKVPAEYKVLDIQKGIIEEKFDMVFCSFLLEHVEDDISTLLNLNRMCGKYLFISTIQGNYDAYKEWELKMGHLRNYHVGELEEKIHDIGFTIIEKIMWGFPFYSPIVRRLQILNSNVGIGKYDIKTRLISFILNLLYYFNSSSKGDILIILAEKKCT